MTRTGTRGSGRSKHRAVQHLPAAPGQLGKELPCHATGGSGRLHVPPHEVPSAAQVPPSCQRVRRNHSDCLFDTLMTLMSSC
jgi:hypothetical protein